jgi:HlyD family secretion protein
MQLCFINNSSFSRWGLGLRAVSGRIIILAYDPSALTNASTDSSPATHPTETPLWDAAPLPGAAPIDITPRPRSRWRSGLNGLNGLSGWRGLLIGLGAGAALATVLTHLPKADPAATKAPPPAGQSVSVATVQQANLAQTLSTQGTVDSSSWVAVLPKASGVQIQEIRVKEGDRVEAGQVIAVLDNSVQKDRLNQADSQIRSADAQLTSADAQLSSSDAQVASAQALAASVKTTVQQRQAKLEQQQHNLEKAAADLQRYEGLAKEGAISALSLDTYRNQKTTAEDGVNAARADVAQARADVAKSESDVVKAQADREKVRADGTKAAADKQANVDNRNALSTQAQQSLLVTAPTSGLLSKKNPNDSSKVADVGSLTGNAPLFYIQPDDALELQVKVPESLLAQVRSGSLAAITSDADPSLKLQGRVREVNPTIDPQTRQATVKISLPSQGRLKPGMFLRAQITVKNTPSLVVPAKAVLPQADGQKIVYVLPEGSETVKAQPVQVGDPKDGQIAIQTGLRPGDRVVVAGAGYVKDGDRVTVVDEVNIQPDAKPAEKP